MLPRSLTKVLFLQKLIGYAKPLVSEVEKAHECTKVIFEVPLVVPDMSAHNVVVAFDPYKTNIDEVQIDLPPLKQFEIDGGNADVADIRKRFYVNKLDGLWYPATKTKYNLYKSLQREFSDWGTDMNTIAEGKRILAGGYYTIYPAFRKAYSTYTPITDKKFEVPGQFMLKIRPYKKMREALKIVTDNKGK